jgi:hypothetical protein
MAIFNKTENDELYPGMNTNVMYKRWLKNATWMFLFFILSCSTRQQESSEIQSKSRYDSLVIAECDHPNLSREFQIRTKLMRYVNKESQQDSSVVKVYLSDKATHELVDSMLVTSDFLLKEVFMNCGNVMSYSTKFNTDMEVVDNYYGDIVIADLNFDDREDVVVTHDSGGNGGPFYSYFLQTDSRTFSLDRFLTDSMTYFPAKLNSHEKTLVTYVHAGTCGLGEHVYQLDPKTARWASKSHNVINVCDE